MLAGARRRRSVPHAVDRGCLNSASAAGAAVKFGDRIPDTQPTAAPIENTMSLQQLVIDLASKS